MKSQPLWLAAVQNSYVDDDADEPPVPTGLQTLSPALEALAELLMLETDLVDAEARGRQQSPAPAKVREPSSWRQTSYEPSQEPIL